MLPSGERNKTHVQLKLADSQRKVGNLEDNTSVIGDCNTKLVYGKEHYIVIHESSRKYVRVRRESSINNARPIIYRQCLGVVIVVMLCMCYKYQHLFTLLLLLVLNHQFIMTCFQFHSSADIDRF